MSEINAKSDIPVIHQVFNSCGIAGILMLLKPNKNKKLDSFLRSLEKKITKLLGFSTRTYDFLDRVQLSLAWLVLDLLYNRYELIQGWKERFPELENTKSLISSKLDESIVYQKTKGNKRLPKDVEKLFNEGSISQNLVEAYIDEQKTDVELKFLGSIFGLSYVPIREEEGGGPLGTIENIDPKEPERYLMKVRTLSRFLTDGGVLGNYEFHWLALREIRDRIHEFKEDVQSKDSMTDIATTPHYFKMNNPLSGTVLVLNNIDILKKYNLYCFVSDMSFQHATVEILKSELKLK